jgi:hypothetical protein
MLRQFPHVDEGVRDKALSTLWCHAFGKSNDYDLATRTFLLVKALFCCEPIQAVMEGEWAGNKSSIFSQTTLTIGTVMVWKCASMSSMTSAAFG